MWSFSGAANMQITSAMMFATQTSQVPSMPSSRLPSTARTRSVRRFWAMFSRATRTASGSMSTASTSFAPSIAAPMARMPLPQPTSMTRSPGRRASSSRAMHMPVVSWVPLPKAMPGSISMTRSPSLGSYSSQVGFTTRRFPARKGL